MKAIKNCAFCGKPFFPLHFNQKFCCFACRTKATRIRIREENQRLAKLSDVRRNFISSKCKDLWKEYKRLKKLGWIAQLATLERKLKDEGCWFKRKLHMTKQQKQLAEKGEIKIAAM